MSRIEEALARKQRNLPQFDYMWRVELPELGSEGFIDPYNVIALNIPPDVSEFVTGGDGGGKWGKFGQTINKVGEVATNAYQNVAGKVGSAVDAVKGKIAKFTPGFGGEIETEMDYSTLGSVNLVTEKMTDELNHRVYSVDAPYRAFEVDRHTFGHRTFMSATTNSVGNVAIGMDEYEDGMTLSYLMQWQKLIRNDDGTNNPPATYKRNIKLIKMAASGLDLHITIFKGCFPSEIGNTSFNYESNAITQYNVTFSCDEVENYIIPAADVLQAILNLQPDILRGDMEPEEEGDFLSKLKDHAITRNLSARALTEVNNRVGRLFF